MGGEISKKVPPVLLGISIAIAIAVIASISLQGTNDEIVTSKQPVNPQHSNTSVTEGASPYLSSKLYSGPFAIFNESYGINDTVFFIGNEIQQDSRGEILFIRPDGEIHHTLHFDGSKQAVNHYFTPVSPSDLNECLDCEFLGTWEIAFRPIEGISYSSIYFEVEDSR